MLLLLLSSGSSGCTDIGSSKGGRFVDEEHARHVDLLVRAVRHGGIAQRITIVVSIIGFRVGRGRQSFQVQKMRCHLTGGGAEREMKNLAGRHGVVRYLGYVWSGLVHSHRDLLVLQLEICAELSSSSSVSFDGVWKNFCPKPGRHAASGVAVFHILKFEINYYSIGISESSESNRLQNFSKPRTTRSITHVHHNLG